MFRHVYMVKIMVGKKVNLSKFECMQHGCWYQTEWPECCGLLCQLDQ